MGPCTHDDKGTAGEGGDTWQMDAPGVTLSHTAASLSHSTTYDSYQLIPGVGEVFWSNAGMIWVRRLLWSTHAAWEGRVRVVNSGSGVQ